MDLRHTEHGHDLVPDELFERPAVLLDDLPHRVEEAQLDAAVDLGITFSELGRVDQVAEEDGYHLPLLAEGRGWRELRSAMATGCGRVVVLAAAIDASGYGRTL